MSEKAQLVYAKEEECNAYFDPKIKDVSFRQFHCRMERKRHGNAEIHA